MANGPEASPPAASVPTPQLTILGLMVKLETWWATESSVYIPTPVPGMAASSSRRLAPAERGWAPTGPAAVTDSARKTNSGMRRRRRVRMRRVVATAPVFLLGASGLHP